MASSSRTLRLATRITSPLRGVEGGGAFSTHAHVHRPLASAAGSLLLLSVALCPSSPSVPATARVFATQPVTQSLWDSPPNWNNRPSRETILYDDNDCYLASDNYSFTSDDDCVAAEGFDFEHWLVVMEPPPRDPGDPDVPREEIIDSYIKVLSKVIGSEEKARQKIYSVSTRHYFAFGALVSKEISYKIKELPNVRWVLPYSYLDVENKDYRGEPFINGEAAPYDPKYHEQWVRNNAHATTRCQHNNMPHGLRITVKMENVQNFHNRDAPPDGCDFEHWLVVMMPPLGDHSDPDIPREEIIDSYIKALSMVVGRHKPLPSRHASCT